MRKKWLVLYLCLVPTAPCGCGSPTSPSLFHHHVAQGNVNEVRKALRAQPNLVNVCDTPHNGKTPLHVAAECGQGEVVEVLLGHGAGIEARDTSRRTPLHSAAEGGHTTVVDILIRHDASIEALDRSDNTPLDLAAAGGHAGTARVLLGKGARVNGAASKVPPLHSAAMRGHAEVVQILLEHGAPLVATSSEYAPLHYAAIDGHAKVCELLISRGAQKNVFTGAALGDVDCVRRALVERPELLNARENYRGYNALGLALKYDRGAVVRFLLEQKVEVNSAPGVLSALHLGACRDDPETVELLLANGANVNAADSRGETPLFIAAEKNNVRVARVLVQHGANVNVRNTVSSSSPLHEAARKGAIDVVELLLKKGADPNAEDEFRQRPLNVTQHLGIQALIKEYGGRPADPRMR